MQSANALKPKKLINQEAIMSKMKRVAIFLLLLMFLPYACADWFYNSEYDFLPKADFEPAVAEVTYQALG